MTHRNAKIALVATLDSKGEEVSFLRDALAAQGRSCCVFDIGTAGQPGMLADITRESLLQGVQASAQGPAATLAAVSERAAEVLVRMVKQGEIGAVAGIGGGKGSGAFHRITQDLPYGFPKLLISSARPALLAEIATTSDTILMPTLVDLFGVNRFTRMILTNAAGALAGLDWQPLQPVQGRVVAITAFGVTTPAANRIKDRLAAAGIEAVVFPANGAGGRTMEALIEKGQFDGVIDLTTTELADLLVGGTASAGESRLTAAIRVGVPLVVAPGAIDMVNFGRPETVPETLRGRPTYRHTPLTTLVRTTSAEAAEIGKMTAARLAAARAPVLVAWPREGVSDYDRPGQIFYDPRANAAWREALGTALRPDIPVQDLPFHINDPAFAETCADWMIRQLEPKT